ncbi:MAG: VWA domain-containing protein [Phycisphaerae bacterium]|nr:VWA domain-containing protein [Phycisphaerae bacterium]
MLPVELRLPESRVPSHGAVAIVIDRSGSMAERVGSTGRSQQHFANEAAITAIRSLSRGDFVAVVAFDGAPAAIVPLRKNDDPSSAAPSIRAIAPAGSTNVFRAIEAAASELRAAPTSVKHIVLLSDGKSDGDAVLGGRRAAELRREGITMSTISIGDSAADQLLAQLAHAGGRRHHRVAGAAVARQLPDVLRREAETIHRAPIREGGPYELAVTIADGPLRGVTSLPRITGYGVVAERDQRAIVATRGPEGDPFGAWGAEWRAWSDFDPFWRQLVRRTARSSSETAGRLMVERTESGDQVVLTVTTLDGAPAVNAVAQARYLTLDGTRGTLTLDAAGRGPDVSSHRPRFRADRFR